MKTLLKSIVVLLLVSVAAGAIVLYRLLSRYDAQREARTEATRQLTRSCEADHRSYEEFDAKFPIQYVASDARKAQIVTGSKGLAMGASREDVLTSLGEPDYVQAGISKDGTKFNYCSWTYYLWRRNDDADYRIEIFLDSHSKVMDKSTVNVPSVPNRGVRRE